MKLPYLFIASLILLSACTKTRKAPNGHEITVIREGEGKYAAPGQYLVMNMLYKDAKDSVWNDTRRQNIPVVILLPDTSAIKNEKGMESAFRILKKGDSVTLKVKAQSLFQDTWKQVLPPKVKPETELTFLLGITDITDQAGITTIQEKIQAREFEKRKIQQDAQMGLDTVAIDAYLARKNIVAIKDKSGLRYVISRQGKGGKPGLENILKVNYKGMLMESGKIFDQSMSPVEFRLSQMIQGWQFGLQLLPRGSNVTFYIPSSLGYGANGYPPDIPGNANLIFEVELIDFK